MAWTVTLQIDGFVTYKSVQNFIVFWGNLGNLSTEAQINRYFGQPQGIAPTGTVVGAIPCGCPGCFY